LRLCLVSLARDQRCAVWRTVLGPVLLIVETFGLIAVVMPSDGWRRLALWLVSQD
jgi:hypothetical protein